jgi:hypothetical protein
VAFSDPNDILSWRLKPCNLELPHSEWGSVEETNVYLSNDEFSIPLLFSTPTDAHGGYFVNPTVMGMLVCGVKNGAPAHARPESHPDRRSSHLKANAIGRPCSPHRFRGGVRARAAVSVEAAAKHSRVPCVPYFFCPFT